MIRRIALTIAAVALAATTAWAQDSVTGTVAYVDAATRTIHLTDGRSPLWDSDWQKALAEYGVPVRREPIKALHHREGRLETIVFHNETTCSADAMFTTRGDVYHTALAEDLGARQDEEGQLLVDGDMRTTVKGLYAAGCVTPANCQMIIAAGQGATAAQAIDQDLFEESLRSHRLPRASNTGAQGVLN